MNYTDYPRKEYQGLMECRHCRAPIRKEWRVQDHRGRRLGKYVERYACRCYERHGHVLGELLEAKETLDRPKEDTP